MSTSPLTPTQRSQRARIAAHARWAKEPDRLAATAPGRRAAFEKLLDEVDPEHKLTEAERLKRAKNAQQAQLERIRLAASKSRRRGVGGASMMRNSRPNLDELAVDQVADDNTVVPSAPHGDGVEVGTERTSRTSGDDTSPAENSAWILTSGAAR